MIEIVRNIHLLEKCTQDILSVIKPTEDDQKKRLGAVEEIVNSIHVVGVSRGGRHWLLNVFHYGTCSDDAVKPFGSFASKLYAKSGDLDVSVQLSNHPGFPTSKKKKKKALIELGRALQTKGVARDVHFILNARVPVLQYVSSHFGISCDISIDNLPGRIKSRVLYRISTLDDRFGDMVLLVKEWARAQNINDPKTGTLSSYTLCILVIIHFQQYCKPAILPPLKEIFCPSIAEGIGRFNADHSDQMWEGNIAKLRRQNIGQRNQSSLSHLLATFFEENSTYFTGLLKQTQEMAKSSCRIVDDPYDISDKAAMITVDAHGLQRIASAFERAEDIIDSNADWTELVSLLCTPEVGSRLGARATPGRYTNPEVSFQQHIPTGSTGSGPIRRPREDNGHSVPPYWRRQQRRDQQESRRMLGG